MAEEAQQLLIEMDSEAVGSICNCQLVLFESFVVVAWSSLLTCSLFDFYAAVIHSTFSKVFVRR